MCHKAIQQAMISLMVIQTVHLVFIVSNVRMHLDLYLFLLSLQLLHADLSGLCPGCPLGC